MNKIKEPCQVFTFKLPELRSLKEFFLAPRIVSRRDQSIPERMQNWFIDNSDFFTQASKSMNERVLHTGQAKSILTIDEVTSIYEDLDTVFLAESLVGRGSYTSITSMFFRSIELFSQSAKNSVNSSTLPAKIKRILDLLIMPSIFLFTFWLGNYDTNFFILYVAIPFLLENILSFTWANYFRQIHTLSSSKDFNLNDFISKNIKFLFIRMLPFSYILLYASNQQLSIPASITICKNSQQLSLKDFKGASGTIEELLLEPIAMTLGKMFFDLAYILILKTFSKDADLRDPMGWMFSRFRNQISSKIEIQVDQEEESPAKQENLNSKRTRKYQKAIKTGASEEVDNELWNRDNPPTGGGKKRGPKNKEPENEMPSDKKKDSNPPKPNKPIMCVNVKVGTKNLAFKRIESSTFNKEIFGLILADPRKTQNIGKYKESLSSGKIGGNIRQLKRAGDRYEIGAKNTDFRLIGKMYNNGVYDSLQGFMSLEDALHVSQELERRGIPDNAGLIIFSVETNHKNITQVANKL